MFPRHVVLVPLPQVIDEESGEMTHLNPIPEESGMEQEQSGVKPGIEQGQNGMEEAGSMELGPTTPEEEKQTVGISDLPPDVDNETESEVTEPEAGGDKGTEGEGEGEGGEEPSKESEEPSQEGEEPSKEVSMDISAVPQIEVLEEERGGEGASEVPKDESKKVDVEATPPDTTEDHQEVNVYFSNLPSNLLYITHGTP